MKRIWLILFVSFAVLADDLAYVNWENHPVHALAISADKTQIAVAHTADNRVQLFDVSLGYPVRLGHVKVGVDPVSVRFRNNNELWAVNHISDSISIIDVSNKKLKATLQTSDEPFDVVFANNKAFVSCSQANQILVFDLDDLESQPVIIDVMAEDPRAMAVNSDGSKVYVASFESGNKSTILAGGIDESNGTLGFPGNPVNREASPYQGQNPPPNDGNDFFPAINPTLPEPPKVSLIVKQNAQGRWMDDNGSDWTHMISGEQADLSGRVPGWELLDHDITIIDTSNLNVSYVGGLMNIGMAIAFNSASNEVSLVGTDATNEVRFEPVVNGKFLRVNIGIVANNDLANPVVKDLNPHLDYSASTVDQSIRNQSIGDPRGIVWSSDGAKAYISGMGSNNVTIINTAGDRLGQIDVGEGATGLALDEERNRLYVWNHFEASLSSVDLTNNLEISKTQIFNPLPEAIKAGREFLYNTHKTSGLGQIACASCHVDARMDKLAWDLGDPSANIKTFNQNCQTQIALVTATNCSDFHPLKGPMMTQTFQDIIGNEPFHWRGDRNGIEEFNGAFESLNGDDEQLTASQMQQLKAMLASITFPPNPFRNLDNSLPETVDLHNHYTSGRFSPAGVSLISGNPQNGLELYNKSLLDGVLHCGSCHTIPTGMAVNGPLKLGSINVPVGGGSIMPIGPLDANHLGVVSVDGSTQKSIKTPQLRNLYEKVGFEMSRNQSLSGFGFLHDGAIDSVARFLSAPAFSVESDQEVADLVALMMAFSGSELDDADMFLGNIAEQSQDTHAAVGKQYTLTQATQMNVGVENLVAIAETAKVDLIVSTSSQENYLFDAENNIFVSQDNEELSNLSLMSTAGNETTLTYSVVPKGLGQRLAFDRDGDGVFDFQEIINGSDITDASSIDVRPRTGLWYNPARNGHGMDIQFVGNTLFIIWYTYNDDMTPTWYLASATYSQNWQADLLSFTWDANTRTATSNVVGTVNISFNNAKDSQFDWTLSGRSGSEPFIYFDVSNQATSKQFTGTYFDSNDPGWGLSVYTQAQSQVVVVYYYDENGMPRWSLGSTENQQNTNIEMLSFMGFCPDCDFVATTNEIIGTINLNFGSNRDIGLSLALQYPDNTTDNWDINTADFTALSSEFFDSEVQ